MNNYYVYIHVDPLSKEVVYVGKGCSGRAWDVTRSRGNHKDHQDWMYQLMDIGYLPIDWVIITHKKLEEEEAFLKEKELLHETGVTRFNRQTGERQHQSKMTNNQAIEAFKLRDEGWSHKEIADKYKVSRSAISMLLSGKQWRTVTKEVRNEN